MFQFRFKQFQFRKLQTLVAVQGAKIQENKYLRIQGRMQILEKILQMALNHVLTLPKHRSRRADSVCIFIEKGVFCVELWSNEGSYRILIQIYPLRA